MPLWTVSVYLISVWRWTEGGGGGGGGGRGLLILVHIFLPARKEKQGHFFNTKRVSMAKWILSSLKIAMKSVQMPLFHGALQSLYGMATECVAPIPTVYAFMQIHSVIIHMNSCSCKLL